MGIAFALHVAGGEYAVEPGSLRALDWSLPIVGQVISKDFCFGGIGGSDSGPAMDEAVRLIKIHRLGDVIGDDGILLPKFCHAIYLNSKQNRNALATQVASQEDCRRGPPTLAEKNDAGSGFLFGGENAVAVCVEQLDDCVVGALSPPIFEDSHIRVLGKFRANSLCELNWAVVLIVVADEATHETDHDVGWRRNLHGAKLCGIHRRGPRHSCSENR